MGEIMYEFKRGISNPDFIDALKKNYAQGGLWKKIVDDKDLFIGIRDESINVYFKGNSLLKIRFEDGNLKAYTHFKYLLKNKIKSPYIRFGFDQKIDFSKESLRHYFYNEFSSMDTLKRTSRPYVGVEKDGVHKIVKANSNVIDVEIALTQEAEDREKDEQGIIEKEDPSNPRIDFAAFRRSTNGIELQFFEAKHFSYTKALRIKGHKKSPRVMEQIHDYKKLLIKYERDIEKSYKNVCKNLVELLPSSMIQKAVKEIAGKKDFRVCIEPRLVIFGFDEDQRTGNKWRPHIERLNTLLPDRVLCKGSPNNFTNGIEY
jgi:hypothetical protein